jgi:hypothetical protein
MTLLDNIESTSVTRSDFGRLFRSEPVVKYVSPEEYLSIREEDTYETWFSVVLNEINEQECSDIMDVFSTIRNISSISPFYMWRNEYDTISLVSLYVGINCDVQTVKDAVKFVWIISSAFWRTFRNVRTKVEMSWASEYVQKGKNFLRFEVRYDEFLEGFDHFYADLDHNNLDRSEKDKSILYHLVGRPISHQEAIRMVHWCRTFNRVIKESRRTSTQPVCPERSLN